MEAEYDPHVRACSKVLNYLLTRKLLRATEESTTARIDTLVAQAIPYPSGEGKVKTRPMGSPKKVGKGKRSSVRKSKSVESKKNVLTKEPELDGVSDSSSVYSSPEREEKSK